MEKIDNLAHEPEPQAPPAAPPAPDAQPSPSGAPAAGASGGVVDEPPDPAKIKTEIEQLEERKRKAAEDALYWRKEKANARAEYFRGREEPPPQAPPAVGLSEPKPTDFDNYDAYVAAMVDHKVKAARVSWEQDQARKVREAEWQDRQKSLQEKLQEGFQTYPDFEEVAFNRSASHITPMIVDILADCDHPADVAYYLAKNVTDGVAISRMTPVRAARAIAKLEADIVARRQSGPPPPKKTTNAPPPIKPLGASGASAGEKDPEKMTPKEYNKWRESQGARRF